MHERAIDLACKIYVDADVDGECDALAPGLAARVGGTLRGAVVTLPGNELEVRGNEDYHPIDRTAFPDGFLRFRCYIEIDPVGAPALDDQVRLVSDILSYLWTGGRPAVAACDYEDRLPHAGGYKSEDVPWPGA